MFAGKNNIHFGPNHLNYISLPSFRLSEAAAEGIQANEGALCKALPFYYIASPRDNIKVTLR